MISGQSYKRRVGTVFLFGVLFTNKERKNKAAGLKGKRKRIRCIKIKYSFQSFHTGPVLTPRFHRCHLQCVISSSIHSPHNSTFVHVTQKTSGCAQLIKAAVDTLMVSMGGHRVRGVRVEGGGVHLLPLFSLCDRQS